MPVSNQALINNASLLCIFWAGRKWTGNVSKDIDVDNIKTPCICN